MAGVPNTEGVAAKVNGSASQGAVEKGERTAVEHELFVHTLGGPLCTLWLAGDATVGDAFRLQLKRDCFGIDIIHK